MLVIERFACMASTRLSLRPINRRSPTRGSCSLSPPAYPLLNSRPNSALTGDGMIQSHGRSSTSTSTSTASLSSSTKNSQNKTMHRSGRLAALKFRNHFGGHSVMVAVLSQILMHLVCDRQKVSLDPPPLPIRRESIWYNRHRIPTNAIATQLRTTK